MLFTSNKILGLDIGSSSIKIAELNITKKDVTLVSFGIVPTPADSILNGEILDQMSLSSVVRSLVTELKIKRKNTAVNIWGPAVIVKRVTMPKIDVNLVSEQIKWEAEQYIPFDINEISLDFHILENQESSDETMDVLLIAAKKQIIFNYLSTLEAAKLKCTVVDVSSFALENCFEENYGTQTEEIALLNIGANVSNFSVVKSGEVIFCRDIPAGGVTFTNDLYKELGVSLDEAESLKIDYSAGREIPDEVRQSIEATIEVIADEIQNSFDFYSATVSEGNIVKFYMAGGGASLPGLGERISSNVEVPFEFFNPFKKIKYNTKKFTSDYIEQIKPYAGIAIGLALKDRVVK